ncbi:hypothetical protein SXCC_00785 [Gluconacetobacter sp. SXCC-1]|nr:hypothetical protein SXCC_00785 [Gluconacetobacter sp. SXCC-1]
MRMDLKHSYVWYLPLADYPLRRRRGATILRNCFRPCY